MNNQSKNECCNGCQNGKPGGNPTCQAKFMVKRMKVERILKNKN